MATGYTDKVLQGADFKEFATTCARAFGALIEMRDDSLDAPIPEKLEDSSSKYHEEAIAKAKKDLVRFKKMSLKRAFNAAAKEYRETKQYHEKAIQSTAENCFKLATVLAKAAAYDPPSPDHVNFKKFMVEQLSSTIDFDGNPDYHVKALKDLRQQTPEEYKAKGVEKAQKDIDYHNKELTESRERNAGRNLWLSQLRNSLKNV